MDPGPRLPPVGQKGQTQNCLCRQVPGCQRTPGTGDTRQRSCTRPEMALGHALGAAPPHAPHKPLSPSAPGPSRLPATTSQQPRPGPWLGPRVAAAAEAPALTAGAAQGEAPTRARTFPPRLPLLAPLLGAPLPLLLLPLLLLLLPQLPLPLPLPLQLLQAVPATSTASVPQTHGRPCAPFTGCFFRLFDPTHEGLSTGSMSSRSRPEGPLVRPLLRPGPRTPLSSFPRARPAASRHLHTRPPSPTWWGEERGHERHDGRRGKLLQGRLSPGVQGTPGTGIRWPKSEGCSRGTLTSLMSRPNNP